MLDTQLVSIVALTVFCGLLLWAAVTDYRHFIIPNHATLGALALYPAYAATLPDSNLWIAALFIAVVFFGVGYLMYVTRTMGAGDAKLLPVVVLWTGAASLMNFLVVMIVASFVLAAIVGLRAAAARLNGAGEAPLPSGPAAATAPSPFARIGRLFGELRFVPIMKLQVPYGVAIAAGGLYVSVNALFTAVR